MSTPLPILSNGAPLAGAGTRTNSTESRSRIWIGHVFFVLYCTFSVYFYRERVLYDTSVFLNTGPLLDGVFFRALDRLPVQLPPQLLPLLSVKLGATSQVAAAAYSLNFALFHYGFWVVMTHVFRRIDLGAAYVLCILVHLVHNNIFIQADVLHAAGYLILFLAAAELPPPAGSRDRLIRFASLQVFALAACFSHPLMPALTIYYTLYSMLVLHRADMRPMASVVIAVSLYTLNRFTFMDNYEAGAIEKTLALSHLRHSLDVLPNYLWQAHRPALLIVAVFAFAVLTDRKNASMAILTALTLLGLGGAICSWIPLGEHSNWQFSGYTWMYFLPFYIVIIVPIFDRHCAFTRPFAFRIRVPLQAFLYATVLAWTIAGTILDFHLARERQRFIARVRDSLVDVSPPIYLLLDEFSINPLLRENDITLWDDSLLISSYDGPQRACMLIPPYGWRSGRADEYRDRYLQPLNPRYFDIPNASPTNASVVNTTAEFDAVRAAARDIELLYPNRPSAYSFAGGSPEDYRRPLEIVYSVPVHMINRGAAPFPSRVRQENPEVGFPTRVTIGYCWVLGDRVIAENRRAEVLPIDLRASLVHNIPVQRKGIPRDATLSVGLFADDKFLVGFNGMDWPAMR